jgi:chorismate synthase
VSWPSLFSRSRDLTHELTLALFTTTYSTVTNWSGGIQGGITNGEDIYFRYVPFSSSAPPPFLTQ